MVGSAAFECEACGERRPALRRTLVDRLPETLVVHLNRAHWLPGGGRVKSSAHVRCPLRGLDLSGAACLWPDASCRRSLRERGQSRRQGRSLPPSLDAAVSPAPSSPLRAAGGHHGPGPDSGGGGEAGACWPASSLPASEALYDAVGVVRHKGRGIDTGHYVAYRREESTEEWVLADDKSVAVVAADDVAAAQAYMVVYQRRGKGAAPWQPDGAAGRAGAE